MKKECFKENFKTLWSGILFAGIIIFCAGWTNALKPQGESVKIDLKQFTSVVTSSQPDDREKFAAKLLTDLLPQMLDVNLVTVKPSDTITGQAIRFAPIDPALGDSGYRIEIENNDIVLSGGTRRGVINAVIALLEEDLGVRWYAPNEKPRLPELIGSTIEIVPRSYQPKLIMREPFYHNAFNPYWEIYNRTNQTCQVHVPEKFGGSFNFPRGAFCHTLFQFLPASLFKTHPEYFAVVKGKRMVCKHGSHAAHACMTNQEVAKIVAENAIKLLEKEKNPCEIISISQNDGKGGFCQCPKCKQFIKSHGEVSDLLLHFVNQVAKIIGKKYPDIKVVTLAYLDSFKPPKTVRPAKNVYIRLCTDQHAWCFPLFYIEETNKFYSALKGWHKIGANLLIWDYVIDFNNYLMPNPNLWVMDHNFDVLLANGAKGVMLQASYQSPGGADAYLKSWIFAKRMWNQKWKLDALLNDFIEGYYGDAAPYFLDYYALQKREWQKFRNKYKGTKLVKPGPKFVWSRSFIDQSRELLDKALETALDNQELTKRIQYTELNWLYMRLSAGLLNKADVGMFRSDIKKFRELARKFKVTHYKEHGSNNQIEGKIMKFECFISDKLYRKCPRNGFLFNALNVRICKNKAYYIKDGDRVQIAQKGGIPIWSMQWSLNLKKFIPGRKYKFLVYCRVDAKPGKENYFQVGVWSHDRMLQIITAKSSDFKGNKLVALESKPFISKKKINTILFVSPCKGKLLNTLYIDHILLVPVK